MQRPSPHRVDALTGLVPEIHGLGDHGLLGHYVGAGNRTAFPVRASATAGEYRTPAGAGAVPSRTVYTGRPAGAARSPAVHLQR